jgi:hypothetical protein
MTSVSSDKRRNLIRRSAAPLRHAFDLQLRVRRRDAIFLIGGSMSTVQTGQAINPTASRLSERSMWSRPLLRSPLALWLAAYVGIRPRQPNRAYICWRSHLASNRITSTWASILGECRASRRPYRRGSGNIFRRHSLSARCSNVPPGGTILTATAMALVGL